jgi:hypothetical protein
MAPLNLIFGILLDVAKIRVVKKNIRCPFLSYGKFVLRFMEELFNDSAPFQSKN